MMLASWQVGQVAWAMLWFAVFFVLVWLVVTVLTDVMRSTDLSGWAKALWTLLVIVLPWFGALMYLVTRGGSRPERQYEVGYYGPRPSVP